MGHCNHSLPSSVYHSQHVEHSLSLLLDFSWPQTTSLALLYHSVWKASWSTAVLKNSMLQSPLSFDMLSKFVDWKCFGDGWCLMDVFRLNYFIRSRYAHSNNRWHKFHGSIRKSLGVWTTIWPEFTFRNMTFLMVSPTSSIGTLPWCLSSTMTYLRTLFVLIVEK